MFETGGRLALALRRRVFSLRLVCRARGAEPAFIMPLVDCLSPFRRLSLCNSPPQLAHAFVMKGFGRSHKDVVTIMLRVQTKLAESLFEACDDFIRILFWRYPSTLSESLNIYPVLVRPRQKIGLVTALAIMTLQAIGDNRRIETAKMRKAVGVVDRRCDVKSLHYPNYSELQIFWF